MASIAVDDMLERGVLAPLDAEALDSFLQAPSLGVILAGDFENPHGEGHDVAVALRELLREHAGHIRGGLLTDASCKASLRVQVLPSIVFVAGGAVLEVVPRVRDWAEYAQCFARYLGVAPPPGTSLLEATA